jgi:hypothetical protein
VLNSLFLDDQEEGFLKLQGLRIGKILGNSDA